jgi:hypothetical protein
MATPKKLKSTKKRVKVKDLPAGEKKMSKKEMEKVKGGLTVTMQDVLVSGATPKKRP